MERFNHLRFADTETEAIDEQIADLQKVCDNAEKESLRQKYNALIQRLYKRKEDISQKKKQLQEELEAVRQDNEDAYKIIYYRHVKGLTWMEVFNKVFSDVPSVDPVGYVRNYIVRYWDKREHKED